MYPLKVLRSKALLNGSFESLNGTFFFANYVMLSWCGGSDPTEVD